MDFDFKEGVQGEKKGMRGEKMGGKKFCCVKDYFERYVLWHIPKEQRSLIL